MIPKEIAFQLVELKEKSKTYSAIQRSYKIDEIRTDVAKINNEIGGLTRNVDNILIDGMISNFEIDNWFEGFKNKSDFAESNPRLVYEEEQREFERQRKIVEEKAKQELEEKKERQKAERIEAFKRLLVIEPEDPDKVIQLIKDGFNIEEDVHVSDLSWLFNHGRSLEFIEFLIETGMKINEIDQQELNRQRKIAKERLKLKLEEIERQKKLAEELAVQKLEELERQRKKAEVEAQQKREEIDRQNKIDAETVRQKQIEIERKRQVNKEKEKREAEELQKRLQSQRIEEFRKMCEYGQDNIFKLKQLMDEGLDITKIANFDCLMSCLECRKRADFIRFLVDSGIQVTNKHIKYCYANTKYFTDPLSLINILENAKNLDSEAFEDILKKTKFNVIGTISATCICIFFLFMPQILNREIDNFYYILDGIITILFLFISISFIVDLRKRLKINNTNHLLDNQPPHPKQAGYERPNAQSKIGIAGSVKEFNHKEIKRRKLILWIVVTLISISTAALIYIYFEEVIAFLKVALILVVIIALFIWRYSPTKRR